MKKTGIVSVRPKREPWKTIPHARHFSSPSLPSEFLTTSLSFFHFNPRLLIFLTLFSLLSLWFHILSFTALYIFIYIFAFFCVCIAAFWAPSLCLGFASILRYLFVSASFFPPFFLTCVMEFLCSHFLAFLSCGFCLFCKNKKTECPIGIPWKSFDLSPS